MPTTLILGSAAGDCGKGKIVDYLANKSDVIARYAGGSNAGHTLVVDNKKYVTHLLPSGVLYPEKELVLANGMVLDLRALSREILSFEKIGLEVKNHLHISHLAHVVLPYHKILDEAREETMKLGTTKQGIGPAYAAKMNRIGVRMCDLFDSARLKELIAYNANATWLELKDSHYSLARELPSMSVLTEELLHMGETLRPFVTDTRTLLRDALLDHKHVLLEGAQGVMLDTDHGQYPYVTSSSSLSAGALLGTGLNYQQLDNVIGVSKAYTTRVGAGPLPTELSEAEQKVWREHGGEYGATTGRPRRIGWLDLPLIRYAMELNGLTELALTKLDALEGMGPIKICVAYETKGEFRDIWAPELREVAPVYQEFAPFEGPVVENGSMTESYERFIRFIEQELRLPVTIASHGAGRESTFQR